MLLSIVTALVRNLITVPAGILRSRVAKDAEVLALRHESLSAQSRTRMTTRWPRR
jgi:hypothetical protein